MQANWQESVEGTPLRKCYSLTEDGQIYLQTVDKHLKPLPIAERIDIVKEIQGTILERQQEGQSIEQILTTLVNPKQLAQEYLGNLMLSKPRRSWKYFLTLCAFYSVTGLSGMIILPCLVIITAIFPFLGIVASILGAIKALNYSLGLGLPYMENIGIVLDGVVELNPIIEFVLSVFFGSLLYFIGRKAYQLLLTYCQTISQTKKRFFY